MATYQKMNLAPGTTEGDGSGIALGTGTTQIHDTGTSGNIRDEVWLWATNIDTSSIEVTIAFGYVVDAGFSDSDKVIVTIPPKSGLTLVLAGQPIRGDGTDLRRITATAGTAAKVNVIGYIIRIAD